MRAPLLLLLTLLIGGCVEGRQQGLQVKGPEPSMADHEDGDFGYDVDGDWDSRRESVRKAMSETVYQPQPSHRTLPKPKLHKSVSKSSRCKEPSKRVLREILGPAFISTYMSEELLPEEMDAEEAILNKRLQRQSIAARESSSPFYLAEDFHEVLSEKPAWEVNYGLPIETISADSGLARAGNYRTAKGRRQIMLSADSASKNLHVSDQESGQNTGNESRTKRQTSERLWHCEAPTRFRDLGEDYFPRFLREVDCSRCRKEPYETCEARGFEIRVLRRLEECAPIRNIRSLTFEEDLNGMWKKWVVERLSVSFCCVCRNL